MTATVGFFGKLPAHGDFVRRGLPVATAALLDDWVQAGFARAADPSAAIRGLPPVRFASNAIAADTLALGTMIASNDSVGRDYVLVALHLSPNVSGTLPETLPGAWDEWCAQAEALLIAARTVPMTADATQAALEASALAIVDISPYAFSEAAEPATLSWRPGSGSAPHVLRSDGLPRGNDFDLLIAPTGDLV